MKYPEYIEKLNPEQREAATTISGPLLIIAGAGSGKTTVLVNRLAYMVDSGIDPASILMLTFTNKAADNMVERAKKLSNPECSKVNASTYHSFCATILRSYYKEAGIIKDFNIILESEEKDAILLVKTQAGYQHLEGFLKTNEILDIRSKMINCGLTLDNVLEDIYGLYCYEYKDELIDVYERLDKYKKDKGLLDYDDLLVLTDRLLKDDKIRIALSSKYKYIMVDEYQDTNRLQESIVFKLASTHLNLAVVGDDFQSIYKFRGADVSNIIEFPNRVPNCKKVVISTNYRSTKEILDVANEVMRENAHFGYSKDMKSCGKTGKKPLVCNVKDVAEEAESQLEFIKKWRDQGKPLREVAVIERTSKESAQLETLLTREGIPFNKLGGLKFLEHECVVDMLNLLRATANTADELAYFHILDLIPGIGEVYAHKILADFGTEQFMCNPAYKGKKFYEQMLRIRAAIHSARSTVASVPFMRTFTFLKNKYFEIVENKIKFMNVKDESIREEYIAQMHSDMETVDILQDMASKYNSIPEFLDAIVLDATKEKESGDALTVTTLHSAKGLEWDFVMLSNVMDGVYPGGKDVEEEDKNESLRCLYVALTRAREFLIIYRPECAMVMGKSLVDISPYLVSSLEKNLLTENKPTKAKVNKVYINVNYYEKDEAKRLGAKWDSNARCWYCTDKDELLIRKYGTVCLNERIR